VAASAADTMSDGSPSGDRGISLLEKTALVELVAETVGCEPGPSRIALEKCGYDVDDAIQLLTYAQWVAPTEVSQASRAASFRDLSQTVASVCDVEIGVASAVLRANANDADAAIDVLITGQWKPDEVSCVEPTNSTSCHGCHATPEEFHSLPPTQTVTAAESELFIKGTYARYLRTGESIKVLIAHTEDPGIGSLSHSTH
jgi:hypothetical protein